MSEDLKITPRGIKKTLSHTQPEHAIAEYIWNGFDAGATVVEVNAVPLSQGFDTLSHLTIRDNGEGIPHSELAQKFKPYLESQKAIKRSTLQTSQIQGQEGKGRLTFFVFAETARWETVYAVDGKRNAYSIVIESATIDKYDPGAPQPTEAPCGTVVTFLGIDSHFTMREVTTTVAEHLKTEFGWFLKLNERAGRRILLNGQPLDYGSTIADSASVTCVHKETETEFRLDFIQWKKRQDDYSKVYFLDSAQREKFKQNSRFNNKGDAFYHSVYVTSPLFERLILDPGEETEEEADATLGFESAQRKAFAFLRSQVEELIRERRRVFLRHSSASFLQSLYAEKVVPAFRDNEYDRMRKHDFEEVVKTVYEIEPRFFADLSPQQKRTVLGFLNLLLDSEERGEVLNILEEVLKLSDAERSDLCAILRTSRLNHIVALLKLLTDRMAAVKLIEELVFNYELKANEVRDLQSAIESHYWLFGEQYHLVTAAEPNFEEALRRYLYVLHGDAAPVKIDHPDRLRQMDIFAVRQLIGSERVENIVVELKHPEITLGERELSQVKKYFDVVLSEARFNAGNSDWRFYLVGNDYNRHIERELQSHRHLMEPGLVHMFDNCRIFVRKWSEVFNDFRVRHRFLTDKLLAERGALTAAVPESKEKIRAALEASSAKAPTIIFPSRKQAP